MFYNLIGLTGKIFSFEPNHELASSLRKKYGTCDQIQIINIAVSDFNGLANFEVGSDELAATSSLVQSRGNYEVKVKKINDLVHEFGVPNIIKIDVEGAEVQIIKNILENVKIYRNISFFIEIHFAIIEGSNDQEAFFMNIKRLKALSKTFEWIDASHLKFSF